MKKYIFAAVLSLGILVSPAFTHASGLTSEQIQSILLVLSSFGVDQSVINNVEISLGGGTSTGGDPRPWCHTFNTDLTFGSIGTEVSELNHALKSSGIAIADDTRTFHEDTAASVVKFQAKYGIRQTGYVGPITRAKLNALYGCPPSTVNPLTIDPTTITDPSPVADTVVSTPVTLSSISPSSGPVGTSVRLDGCGSDSSSGFTLYFNGPQSGTIAIPVETLGAASGCGYMTLTVPTYFPAGAYTLSVRNNQTGAMSTNSMAFTVTAPTTSGVSGSSAACTTSFSPNAIKIGDYTTWNFAAGTGDTTFQYSCNSGFTKEDGTTPLSYGSLPLSGAWSIKVPGHFDCTLTSRNPNVTGSGSTCRASISPTFFTIATASLPNASVSTSYNTTLATTNAGTAPYQWSWSPAVYGSGTMPNGLTLNPSTGVISGTPTTAGKYDVVIKVMDAAGNAPTKTLALYVDAQAGASTQCTSSFSPSTANIGDIITWNFQSGAGDTTFQYSCNHGFTKEDGTTPLSYGSLPSSGAWRIKVPGYGFDCTLSSYNSNVIGSGSTCRATLR